MKTKSQDKMGFILILFIGLLLAVMVIGLIADSQPKVLTNKAAEPAGLASGAVANCLKTCKINAASCSCVSTYLQGVGLSNLYPTIAATTQPITNCFKGCEQNRQQCSCVSQYLQNVPIQQIPTLFPSLSPIGQQAYSCFENCKKNSQQCSCASLYMNYLSLMIPTLPPLPTVLPQAQAAYTCLTGCRQSANNCSCVSSYLQNMGTGIVPSLLPTIMKKGPTPRVRR